MQAAPHMVLLRLAAESVCMGMAAAALWRKDFLVHDLISVMGFLTIAVAGSFTKPAGVVIVVVLVYAAVGARTVTGIRKNKLMIAVVSLFAFVCKTAALGFGDFAATAVVAVTFQLIRRPAWLKDALRTVRVATGPLYAASSMAAFAHVDCKGSSAYLCIAAVGIMLVAAAAVVMRPDNVELEAALTGMLGLQVSTTRPRQRAMFHGVFMLMSAVLLAVLLAAEGCVRTLAGLLALLAMEASRHWQPRARVGGQRTTSECKTGPASEPHTLLNRPNVATAGKSESVALQRARSAPATLPTHPYWDVALGSNLPKQV